ncbi:MAG TPA: efflux transporter outer membrane subunit [Rhodanobacteraceae bacterium]|jgi:NodT family efflux transporter outer membrane factor (OMF) lipoprotein|nr:efflux transporter outer membrane subunit [Rhodanobacteraceae bacterium]
MSTFVSTCPSWLRALAVTALCTALGACVSVAVPKLPSDDLPAQWRNASPQLGARPDLTGWWKHFDDPQLDALVDAALRDNLDVQQAVLKLRAARALEDASAGSYKPRVAFNTLEQPNAENTASYFQAGFDATWELGLFGRSEATGHIAQANTGEALAALQSARVSLVAEVVREYLQLRAAQRSETLLAEAAQAAQKKVALMRVQERLQLASKLEVEQAAAAEAKAEAQLADPRAAIVQHAQTLAVLLGKSEPDPAWLALKPLPQLAAVDVDSVPADLLRTRPEIRYAETQVLKAAGELGIAKADMYPRLALGSSLTFAALVKGQTRLGDVNNSFAIGPIINIPLFDWGQRRAVRDAREDELQAAVLAYRQAVLQGAAEVETDLAALHASDERSRGAAVAATASQNALTMSDKMRGLGQADGLQLADAQLALTGSELDREQARLAHGLAYVALYKALGGAPLPNEDAAAATDAKR